MIEEVCQSGPNYWAAAAIGLAQLAFYFFVRWRRERNHRIALQWRADHPGQLWPPLTRPWPRPPAPPAAGKNYLDDVWIPPPEP